MRKLPPSLLALGLIDDPPISQILIQAERIKAEVMTWDNPKWGQSVECMLHLEDLVAKAKEMEMAAVALLIESIMSDCRQHILHDIPDPKSLKRVAGRKSSRS